MLDKNFYEDLSGSTVRELIATLSEKIPEEAKDVPFHACGSTNVYLHVSRDETTGNINGVSIDCSPLDGCYPDDHDEYVQ